MKMSFEEMGENRNFLTVQGVVIYISVGFGCEMSLSEGFLSFQDLVLDRF